jgi:hypothetical protein
MLTSSRPSQDSVLDSIAAGRHARSYVRTTAPSLRPDETLAFACACGNATALAVAECWKFAHPVTALPSDEFDALVERCRTTFEGRIGDAR